ncbi:MAG: hypothetical protein E6Q34_04340 [Burkholderiaceae bacterium]|nr:MAG: hypothetical protein E6Q34_04340 [Burkholderiaceae bacterium]
MQYQLSSRIAACETENARLKRRLHWQNVVLIGITLASIGGTTYASKSLSETPNVISTITVKELVVVDDHNVVRARVGGNIPPAVVDGKTLSRGSGHDGTAGIMLYDRTGVERGGYVTFDHGDYVALTLDNQKKQQVFFGVGPTGSAALQLWENDEMLDLRAAPNGARFTRTKAGAVTHQYPETMIRSATCEYYRSGIKDEVPAGLPRAEVKKICERKFAASSCAPCLPPEK